jgi:hypothetical protein
VHELENDTDVSDYEQLNVKSLSLGKSIDVDEHVRALEQQKARGTAPWWATFRIVRIEVADTQKQQRWFVVRLQCKSCSSYLSANNPSVTALNHCKKNNGQDGKVIYECFKDSRTRLQVHRTGFLWTWRATSCAIVSMLEKLRLRFANTLTMHLPASSYRISKVHATFLYLKS